MATCDLVIRGECACGAAVPLDPDAAWVRERVVVRGEATGTFTLAVACASCAVGSLIHTPEYAHPECCGFGCESCRDLWAEEQGGRP